MDAVAELPGLPGLGNFVDFRRDRLGTQLRAASTAEITRLRLIWRTLWVTGNWELAQRVLVDEEDAFEKGPILTETAAPLLGRGLLTATRDHHRRQRKLMAPAFTPRRIARYAQAMAERSRVAADRLRPHTMIDIAEAMMELTLDIVGRTLFDLDLAGDARDIGDALTVSMKALIGATTLPLPRWLPNPRRARFEAAVATLDRTVLRIIETRRAARAAGPDDRGDVLSILLDARDDDGVGMTDRDLRDETMTLVLAGHETTANLLAWTWYLLAQHPAARDRLEAELDAVLGGRPPGYDDLPRLPYTLAVLEESLRVYPPAYAVGRMALRPIQLGEARLAAGDIVVVSVLAMHRRADYWDQPGGFRPERFLDGERRRPGYLPFGAGPRVCIGNHFALVEAQLVLATWAQRFRFRLAQPPTVAPEPLVTLRPRGGIHVEVEPRP